MFHKIQYLQFLGYQFYGKCFHWKTIEKKLRSRKIVVAIMSTWETLELI